MITGFVIAAVGLSWPAPCAARGCCAPRAVPVRLLCEPAVILKGAEPNFVEPGENLNPDETLVQALKTFDGHNGALLCAGALIWRRTDSHGHVHDLWIADSLDRGVGANVQMRGALRILDALFLRHLRSGVAEFNVLAGSGEGCTTAAHAAARSRGFVHELECPETAELLLRFDWDLGAATYRRVAAGGGADSRTATCIVQELERRRRAWDGAVRDAAASS